MPGSEPSGAGPSLRGGRPRHRNRITRATIPVLLLAILVPYAITFRAIWTSSGEELSALQSERQGLTMMRPMMRLIAATTDAQAAAVGGGTVDSTRLRAAMSEVDAANAQVGGALSMNSRWSEVQARLNQLINAHASGSDAYNDFTDATDQELSLLKAIDDNSTLVLDQKLDTYYLTDAVLLRGPELIVNAGRTADLALLAERSNAASTSTNNTSSSTASTGSTTATQEAQIRAAVTQNKVESALSSMDEALRKSFAATTSRSLGPALLGDLDRVRDTSTTLAPPSEQVGAGRGIHKSAAEVNKARIQVRDATLKIEETGAGQLDQLLADRSDTVAATRQLIAISTAIGLMIAFAISWLRLARRRSAWAQQPEDAVLSTNPATPSPGQNSSGRSSLDEAANLLTHSRGLSDARQISQAGRGPGSSRELR